MTSTRFLFVALGALGLQLLPGVVAANPPPDAQKLWKENDQITVTTQFPGVKISIWYGAGNKWVQKDFNTSTQAEGKTRKTFRWGGMCNNAQFGDPAPGVGKACYLKKYEPRVK